MTEREIEAIAVADVGGYVGSDERGRLCSVVREPVDESDESHDVGGDRLAPAARCGIEDVDRRGTGIEMNA